MGFFKLGKKDKILDLTERYNKQKEQASQIKQEVVEESSQEVSPAGTFGFFGNYPTENSSAESESSSDDERKKKLAKRLIDLTNKIEEISNQIYHLQQRVELLEKKSDAGRY